MGFFREFKNDLSQAVTELLPEDNLNSKDSEAEEIVNTLDMNDEGDNEKMKEWLEEFAQDEEVEVVDEAKDQSVIEADVNENNLVQDANQINENEDETMEDNVDLELLNELSSDELEKTEIDNNEKKAHKLKSSSVTSEDEVTIIAKGTTINGSISSDGALDILGTVNGDVECLGKLSVTGKVKGNASATEVYVNTDRIEGSIISEGSVKVGLGTVVLGDITATSGVIAGAVKGEIDVNGPIIIDSTAIIKGNIKAKSVQINNGAVIEGFCSLSYSSVNVDNIFE